jgi:colicin import membrane protein
MIAESTIGDTERLDGAGWGLMVVVSVMLHLAVFSAAIFLSGSFQSSENDDVVYEVDLVSMPETGPQTQSPPALISEPASKEITPAKKAAALEEKKIPIPPEKTVVNKKKPVVKKVETPVNTIETALAKLEKKVKAEGSEHLNQAISDLEKKNKSEESHLGDALTRLQDKATGIGSKNRTSGVSQIEGVALQIYRGQITSQIYGNWSYPAAMSSKKSLEAIVTLKIKEDGTILESAFKKKSNDSIFDQSVLKAIEKSNPLLPLPEGYGRSYEEIEVTFNLKKLLEN